MPKPRPAASSHLPVMPQETLEAWLVERDGCYIDGTFGRGGHSRLLLEQLDPAGQLLAIDRDTEAIAAAEVLQQQYPQLQVAHAAFDQMPVLAGQLGWTGKVAGILLDLGVSSPQLDQASRGFSFMQDGPLDMRMDTSRGPSAAEWLANAEQQDIARVLRDYGEERFAGRIARAIVERHQQQPLATTFELVELIEAAVPRKEQGKHKATRSFQAIRIAVNSELEQLQSALQASLALLKPGGHLVVISFHSLEDRIVKRFMREQARGDALPSQLPVRDSELNRKLRIVAKARRASEEEIAGNPRARSAVLRVAERLPGPPGE